MDVQFLVADGQLVVATVIALAAGLLSFLSPCVLPLVPGYLAYVGAATTTPARTAEPSAKSGQSHGGGNAMTGTATATSARRARAARLRPFFGSLLFVAGFSLIFILIMALAGTVGVWLLEWENVITRVMGVVIIVMGLVFMGQFSAMQRNAKLKITPKLGLAGAPVLGAVFAIGWTPCMGPTLGVILTLSAQQGSVGRSIVLAIAYCLGLGLPFILAALGFGWMTQATTFMKRHIRTVNIIGGSLLILIGLLMVTGLWTQLMYALQAVIDGYVTPL